MAKASKLRNAGGKLASAKSKTGNPQCSKAMSDWVRNRKTGSVPPGTFAILAKCRAQAKQNRGAQAKQAAGKLAPGRGTWQRSEAAAALLAKRGARPTPSAAPAAKPAAEAFSLKRDSAVGKKATTFDNRGPGRTGSMFDMKKGDLPGQTSIFDKIKTVDTRAGTPAAPAKPANPTLQKAKARIARNRRAGATDGASGAKIAAQRQAQVGSARQRLEHARGMREAKGRLDAVQQRVAGKRQELADIKAQPKPPSKAQEALDKLGKIVDAKHKRATTKLAKVEKAKAKADATPSVKVDPARLKAFNDKTRVNEAALEVKRGSEAKKARQRRAGAEPGDEPITAYERAKKAKAIQDGRAAARAAAEPPSPPAPPAAKIESKAMDTFHELAKKAVDYGDGRKLVAIHEMRAKIKAELGADAASPANFDAALKKLRADGKIRLMEFSDARDFTAAQHKAMIPSMGSSPDYAWVLLR